MFWLCHVEATAGSLVPHRRERCRARAAGDRVLHPRIALAICLGKCRPQQSEEKRPVPKNYFVSFSTKFNIARKKQLVFRRRVVAKMPYSQFSRRSSVVCQLPAY